MGSKLLDKNKQPFSENQYFESFQTPPVSTRTKMEQKDNPGFTSPRDRKELDRETEEVSLEKPLRRLKKINEKLIQEKIRILEERELVIQQEKILKDMQIKINHLHTQLKQLELIGLKNSEELQTPTEALGAGNSQERENVCNCPSCHSQKAAMVKWTQESSYLKIFFFSLGNSVWLFVSYLLYCVCLCLTLLWVYKHLPDPIWVYRLRLPDSVCHQPWTH